MNLVLAENGKGNTKYRDDRHLELDPGHSCVYEWRNLGLSLLSPKSLPTEGWPGPEAVCLPGLRHPLPVSYTPPIFRFQGKAHLMTIVPFPESRAIIWMLIQEKAEMHLSYHTIYSWHAYLGIMNNTNWRLLCQKSDLVPVTSAFFFLLSFTHTHTHTK